MTPDQLLDALPFAVIDYVARRDAGGAVVDFDPRRVNAAAARLMRMDAETLASRSLRDTVGPARGDGAVARLRHTMESGEPGRYRFSSFNWPGRTLEFQNTATADGCVVTFELLSPEDAGAMDAELIALAARAAEIGVWELHAAEDIVVWSQEAERLLGLPAEGRDGGMADMRRLLAPGQEAAFDEALRAAEILPEVRGDWLLQPEGREPRWIHCRTKALTFDATGRATRVVGVAIDVTDKKRLQQSLEESRRAAEAQAEAKSRFLATMSHEIRTPLNGLLGMAELLDRSLHDPAHRRMTAVIRDTGETVLAILNDILDHARIEAGGLTLEARPFSPIEIARRVEAAHAAAASDKGLTLHLDADAGAAAPRLGDAHRIAQMLHNVIGNAVKFTETGGVAIRVAAPPDGPVTFEVRDSGCGMTPEQASRIFDRFAQAEDATTRRYGGSGLGLSIVKGLAEAMNGSARLESRVGDGTTMTIVLPLPCAVALDQAAAPPPPPATLAGLRVLAADDNEINRMVLGQMLDALGAEALICASGEEAAALRACGPADVILLDIAMPGMGGPETLAAIRAIEAASGLPHAPALAFTANVLSEQVAAYAAAGFAGTVPKPIGLSALCAALAPFAPRQALAEARA